MVEPASLNHFPNVPQTRAIRLPVLPEEEEKLAPPHPLDASDPYATDRDPDIRNLGRLLLRRDVRRAEDYFELADRCALKAWGNGGLQLSYIEKTLRAFQYVLFEPSAALAIEAFVRWTVAVALLYPTRENLAIALWAVAAAFPEEPERLLDQQQHLLDAWQGATLAPTLPEPTPETAAWT
ncbi:MAG: hypothetical protein HC915_02370 [Anaerolineae bacterium]|nr:hypothetical protein [Anaerolineae bacterium]